MHKARSWKWCVGRPCRRNQTYRSSLRLLLCVNVHGVEVRKGGNLKKNMVGTRRLELLTSTVSRVLVIPLQELTWCRETAKYPQRRVRQSNHGLDLWGRIDTQSRCFADTSREPLSLRYVPFQDNLTRLARFGSRWKNDLYRGATPPLSGEKR